MMTRRTRNYAVLSVAALGLACASGSNSEFGVVEQSRTTAGFARQTLDINVETAVHRGEYDVSTERLYTVVQRVVPALGIPLESSAPAEGLAVFVVQTQRLRIADRSAANYLSCGNGPAGPRANSYRISLTVTTRVDAVSEGRSRLQLVVAATARDPSKSSIEINCTSTGQLEKLIIRDVTERVAI